MGHSALITGVGGQDGQYLAELLLRRGYRVHGTLRPNSPGGTDRLGALQHRVRLHEADLTDQGSVVRLLDRVRPTEVYNLAGESFVPASWDAPVWLANVSALGVTRLLEAIRVVDPGIRFYQAGSSELFGRPAKAPQDETTPMAPRSPYAAAKAYAFWITAAYRERYGLFACNGVLFNHESPRRNPRFVSRKITLGAARIKLGLARELRLGNLDACRDWGFAGDYVEAMWRMLQQPEPDDYVVGTGQTRSVRDWLDVVFGRLDLDWRRYVRVDKRFYRPAEEPPLVADPTKTRQRLGWAPRVGFAELAAMMADADLAGLQNEGTKPREAA